MRYKKIPTELFCKNREKLARLMKKNAVAVLNANDEMPRNGDQYYPYRQNSNLFYLTGIEQEKSILLLYPDNQDKDQREIFFILKPDKKMETWEGHKLTPAEVTNISGIKTVKYLDTFDNSFKEILQNSQDIHVNLGEDMKTAPEIDSRDKRFFQRAKSMYPLHNYHGLSEILTRLRLEKEDEEITLIEKAIEITGKAFDRVLKVLRPGLHEYEIEAGITAEFTRNGASGHAYAPIVASGKNACILHYTENNQVCKDGELLLLDFGAEYGNYAADCSRTIPVNGEFSPRQRELYNVVLDVFYHARDMMVPGTNINAINEKLKRIWEKEHVKIGLYQKQDIEAAGGENLSQQYSLHGVSHFIGLDVHDAGDKKRVLKPGMVLSCEPGLYIDKEQLGIRLENDILIGRDGPVDLMDAIPIKPDEIENLMMPGTK
jgi:Xaa-Pro aminopeptidase